jgi:enterochelin esterase-like enzyme
MKLIFILYVLTLLLGSNEKVNREMVIYSLSSNSTYLIRVNCDNIKQMQRVKIKRINNQKQIFNFMKIMNEEHLKIENDDSIKLDIRTSICILEQDQIKNVYCWSPTGKLTKNNILYTYDEVVEKYLIDNGFIDNRIK